MSLLSALHTATSGLAAAQASISIASQNITNASVDGYTRKTQEQTSRVVDGAAGSVRIGEATRNVTDELIRDVRDQVSTVEEIEIVEDFLGRLELEFGRPEDNSSISAKLTDLKESFLVLANNPAQATAQADVLRVAGDVVTALRDMEEAIQSLRAEADQRISDSVTRVNTLLTDIDSLNNQIAPLISTDTSTADLEDQRDQKLLELSEEMGVRVFERTNGKLGVLNGASDFLVDEAASTLEFTATASVTAGATLNPINLNNGFIAAFDITSSITDGKIGGLIQLRDTLLPVAQRHIDSLAFELGEQFDAIAIANSGGQSANLELFLDSNTTAVPLVANITGLAGRLQINANVTANSTFLRDGDGTGGTPYASTGESDNRLPLAIVDLFETDVTFETVTGISTTNNFENFSAAFVNYHANQRADFESQRTFQDEIRNLLSERHQDESGVNVDEELASLIQLESAFAASARVLNSVQTALDELLAAVR